MQDAIRPTALKSTRTPSPIACRIAIIKRSAELRPVERLVLRSLADYIGNHPEAICWPSVGTLAAECGISTRQCRRLLRAFEAAGWIECSPRERADGGQTSNTIRWIRPAPAMPAPPAKSIAAPQSASSPAPAPPAAAPQSASSLAKPAPAKSARWIEIIEHRFSDPHEAKRVFLAVVAGGLLTSSEADRLLFFAGWCAVSRKHREKRVKHPAAAMQWLLRHQRVLRAYPAAQDEDKAREAVRRLWPPVASPYAAAVASLLSPKCE